MTAPMTSREELLRNIQGAVHLLRKAIHASDPRTELDLRCHDIWTDLEKAIPAPAQAVANPVMWVCLVPNPLGELRIRAWTADRKRMESLRAEGLDMQALYTSSLPSTGLPAPAPHAEVREALTPFAKIAESYESSIERANRAIIDEAKCAGRGPVEDHALKQPLPDAHRVSVTIGDCRLARSVLAALAPQQDRGGK